MKARVAMLIAVLAAASTISVNAQVSMGRIQLLEKKQASAMTAMDEERWADAVTALEELRKVGFWSSETMLDIGYCYYRLSIQRFEGARQMALHGERMGTGVIREVTPDNGAGVAIEAEDWVLFLTRDFDPVVDQAPSTRPVYAAMCTLTVATNKSGLAVHVVDAATGQTTTDVVGNILGAGGPLLAGVPGFSVTGTTGEDGRATLRVPRGMTLKVEVGTVERTIGGPGGNTGYAEQKEIWIGPDETEKHVIFLF